jgi:hypothetical protein
MSHTYDTAARSRAATRGWIWRRTTTPDVLAARHFYALAKTVPWAPARLYVCDVAEAAQVHFLAAHPGDSRTLDAIAVARRYTLGESTDKERLAAMHLLQPLYDAIDTYRPIEAPAACAVQAACFTLVKLQVWCIEWTLVWADKTSGAYPAGRLDYARHTPALEHMQHVHEVRLSA